MNKAIIIGRLAADPEIKKTSNGIAVTSFTMAVDRPYQKDKEKETDWIDVVAWRSTAEFACKYFQKGSPIIVEGSIQTRFWEDKNGNKRKSVEIVADNVEFVPAIKGLQNGKNTQDTMTDYSVNDSESYTVVDVEDLPF